MTNTFCRRVVLVGYASIASTLLPFASAVADELGKSAAAGDGLEVIIVTARRREENLQAVPIAVSAISGDELVRRGVRNAYDLQNTVPSLTMSTNGTMSKAIMPAIRSVATRSFLLLDDSPVGTYFAEAVVGHPWGFAETFYDIHSVQTLRGPQGTLFGRNTTGGAILVEPNKPDFGGFDANARLTFGNYNLKQVDGMLNVPFNEVVALRLAGQHKEREGYTTNILSGQKRDGVGNYAGRVQLTIRPSETFSTNTIVDLLDMDATPSGAKVAALYGPNGGFGLFGPTTPRTNAFVGLSRILEETNARDFWDVAQMGGTNFVLPTTDPLYAATAQDQASPLKCQPGPYFVANHHCRKHMRPLETLETMTIINNTSWEVGGVTLRNIYSYRTMEHHNEDAATFPFGSPTFYTGLAAAGQPQVSIAGGGSADQRNTLTQITEEFQVQGEAFDERLNWVAGGFYMREWGNEDSPSYTNSPSWSNTQGNGVNESKAVFGQGSFKVTDKLGVTAGVRQTWDERTATDTSFAQSGATFICQTFNLDAAGVEVRDLYPNCALRGDEKWDATSYLLSVDYQLTDGLMAYLLRSRGYKSGGFSLRSHRPSTLEYDPEYMDNTEAGLKADWTLFDRPIRTNLAVFRMDGEDQQLQSTVAGTNPVRTYVDNVGKTKIVGVEFELTFRPLDSVEITGFYSYNDADYTEWENEIGVVGGVDYGTVDLSHRPVGFYSKTNAGLSVAWTVPLDSRLGEFSLRADAAYHSEWLTDNSVAGLVGEPASPTAIPGIVGFTMVPQDAYTMANLRADWRNVWGGPMDLGLFVTNVTDEEVVLGGAPVNGVVTSSLAPPRMYGFEVGFRFGESR